MSGPIPARVDGAAKSRLLDLIDDATAKGWTLSRACSVLEIDRVRLHRWQARRAAGTLEDRAPGGQPIHALLPAEEQAIVELFDEWGPVDLSHRKLAHRGSYLKRVWVSPSTVDRVLARHGLSLRGAKRPSRTEKKPWPEWAEWKPNQLWCWDASQFERCLAAKYAYAIIDLVSRLWVATILVPDPNGIAVRILFTKALEAQGLLTDELAERLADLDDQAIGDDDPDVPLLVAVSDDGGHVRLLVDGH